MPLFSKDVSIFDMLEEQTSVASQAARILLALSQDLAHVADHAAALFTLEKEADELILKLIHRVDSTFVTPLDKEDLHALSQELDNITDAIEAAAARFAIYRFVTPLPGLHPILTLIVQLTESVREAVASLQHRHQRDQIGSTLQRIHALIGECEQSFRQAIADLFQATDPDPILIIKWKDVYERIERTLDNCEEVANLIEGILVKYA